MSHGLTLGVRCYSRGAGFAEVYALYKLRQLNLNAVLIENAMLVVHGIRIDTLAHNQI